MFLIVLRATGNCKVSIYADDAKFYLSRDYHDVSDLTATLDRFECWVEDWQLRIASEKCFLFSVGDHHALSIPSQICGSKISVVSYIKDLGITFLF